MTILLATQSHTGTRPTQYRCQSGVRYSIAHNFTERSSHDRARGLVTRAAPEVGVRGVALFHQDQSCMSQSLRTWATTRFLQSDVYLTPHPMSGTISAEPAGIHGRVKDNLDTNQDKSVTLFRLLTLVAVLVSYCLVSIASGHERIKMRSVLFVRALKVTASLFYRMLRGRRSQNPCIRHHKASQSLLTSRPQSSIVGST
jgi:hypothetical protein